MKRSIFTVSLVATCLVGGVHSARADELGDKIASFATARVGQKVGDGNSTRLVEQAFAAAGANPGSNLRWGSSENINVLNPGYIIQFRTDVNRKTKAIEACVFKNAGATWDLTGIPAVVEKMSQGTKVTILYQDGKGSTVRRLALDLKWRTSGTYDFYRPTKLLDQSQSKPLNQLQLTRDAGWGNMKATGRRPLLVILVEDHSVTRKRSDGTDEQALLGRDDKFYDDLFFNTDVNRRSVNRYFAAVSSGRFSWKRAGVVGPHKFTVRSGDAGGAFIQTDAVLAAAENGFDFAQFDTNKDKVVTLNELGIVTVDNTKTNSGQTRGVNVKIEAQKVTVRMSVAGIGPKTDLMTICHEMMHTLGGYDLYGASSLNNRLSTMAGTGGVDDQRITYYLDPWHRMQFGWVDPQFRDMRVAGSFELAVPQTAENRSGEKPTSSLILFDPTHGLKKEPVLGDLASGRKEYFILEYRNKAAGPYAHHDADVGSTGLAIWHVVQDEQKRLLKVARDDNAQTYDVASLLNRGAPNWVQGGSTLYTKQDGNILLKWMDKKSSGIYLKAGTSENNVNLPVSWTASSPLVANDPVKPSPAKPAPMKPSPLPSDAPAKKAPLRVLATIICSPVDWTKVDLDAGKRWFGSDVPGMREEKPTDASLTALLKKYGFETQYRKVDGKGGSSRLFLFARLTKETKTPYTDAVKREGVRREVGAIADMVYGGPKAVGQKVKSFVPK